MGEFYGHGWYSEATTVTHVRIRGVETDASRLRYANAGIWAQNARFWTIEDNYIHDVSRPTGNVSPGDSTDPAQGGGSCIHLRGWNNDLQRDMGRF